MMSFSMIQSWFQQKMPANISMTVKKSMNIFLLMFKCVYIFKLLKLDFKRYYILINDFSSIYFGYGK